MITVARIALTPFSVGLILEQNWGWALAVFAVAGVSDALDGWLAKTFHLESELGALLDPIADKALIISSLVALAAVGVAPVWLTLLIVTRDAMIVTVVGLSRLFSRQVSIRPHPVSKATTVAQILLIGDLLAQREFGVDAASFLAFLVGLAATLTVASGCVYLWLWVRTTRPQYVADRSAIARRAQ